MVILCQGHSILSKTFRLKLAPTVIYEDEHLLAINKPSNLLVVPDRSQQDVPNVRDILSKSTTPYIVHRLDKATSGLLLIAKHESAHKILNTMFADRKINKYYLCLVQGNWKSPCSVDAPIGPKRKNSVEQCITQQGKSAVSHFNPIESFNGWTLLEVKIETGRTHQIRVHAAHMNHPVVCDELYGDGLPLTISQIKPKIKKNSQTALMQRTALHAHRLEFHHPETSQFLSLEADYPKDFKATINQLRKWRSNRAS